MNAKVVGRQVFNESRERAKIVVTLDDGSTRDYWPYKMPYIPDVLLEAEAIIQVEQSLAAEAEAQANQPVERSEIDAFIAELEKAGLVTGTTWAQVKDEKLVAREVTP